MGENIDIDSAEFLYKALNNRDEIKTKALLMLMVRNWLTEVSNFDPVSGHALHTGIIDFLDAVAKSVQNESPEGKTKDRIYRIVSHSKEAVLAIMEHTRDKILREHAMLPIHAAREVDSKTVQWLSRKPGRTIREKLSGKPHIKAVRRRHSIDTAENRLFKAFLLRLEEILFKRQAAFDSLNISDNEKIEDILVATLRWLRSEDASEIGTWENIPPNNTLLQDKRYRKIWDGWLWLQAIDEQITGDSKKVHRDILSVIYWNTLSLLNHSGRFRTVQQPVNLNYDNFSIVPELPVCGYLFPACTSKIRGKIKFIKPNKSFGFITSDDGRDMYFNPYNLSRKLDINSLSTGDEVSFVIGSNRQGECADDITLPAKIIPVDFNLSNDRWNIQIGKNKYLLQIISDSLVIEQAQGKKKKLKIEPADLKKISKTILSFVTDAPFGYSEPINNQSGPIRVDNSVVNICSIRPTFTNNTGSQTYLPFRLLLQNWKLKDRTSLTIDCGKTKAIVLDSSIETISMRTLFAQNSTLPDATKSSASMFFAKKLSDYIKTDKLTYLIPDWSNDFDLDGVRKSVNFYFEKSSPLPKSIAAVFAWQSSNTFKDTDLNEDSVILVIDTYYGGFSVTPVTVSINKEVKKALPQTNGVTWERHPTITIKNTAILHDISNNLKRKNCPYPEDIIQLFGLEGLIYEAGKFTIKHKNKKQIFHLPNNISDLFKIDEKSNKKSNSKELSDFIESLRSKQVFLLPLNQSIILDLLLEKFNTISTKSELSILKGALSLNKWQESIADMDIALWRDHLPKLSIRIVRDGHFENFYLVKDATVTPQRGRTVDIPVKESFTLPAEQKYYSFPLQQGEGNKELQFVAYLKSPAFPLKEDIVCRLEMTYTYGADNPYELKFIPLDSKKAGFKSIRIEWRSASEGKAADLESLPVPDFPARKSWSDFQNFPKEDGKSFSNLLEWVERDMNEIAKIADFINQPDEIINNNRLAMSFNSNKENIAEDRRNCLKNISLNWKKDRNGKQYGFYQSSIGAIFFHENNFEQFDPNTDEVSFDLEKQKDRDNYVARNITIGKSIAQRTVNHFRKSLRFPILTIWNHGHSLSESDIPDHFRDAVLKGIQKALKIINSENIPNKLKKELFFFLCCLHKDAPGIVRTQLLDAVQDKEHLQRYYRNIAFAIGNAELPWQQKLLEDVYRLVENSEEKISSIALKILAVALWRNETLIRRISVKILNIVSEKLYDSLILKVKNNELINHTCKITKPTVVMRLELLLALLRSRGNKGKEFKEILAPNNDLTKKYVTLVDNVSRIVIESDIKLKSRISLKIEKPEMFRNTPDLLYTLRMYLTGNSGANAIVITGVSDED